jgi:two-component system CheB/CheR fusion protein
LTNAAYDRLFGTAAAEMEPEDAAGLPLPPADRPQQRAARGERFRMEFALVQPGGARRWFEAIAEPLTAGDRTWGGVIAIRDLSERTMRLSLERLMAAAGHELKTRWRPCMDTSSSSNGISARRDCAGPHLAVRALVQARQVGELVERLFDVSRIQSWSARASTGAGGSRHSGARCG